MQAAWAVRLIPSNPVLAVKTPPNKDRGQGRSAFSVPEIKAMLATASGMDVTQGAIWWWRLLTGMRQGEILRAIWADLNMRAGVYTVDWKLQTVTKAHGCGTPISKKDDMAAFRRLMEECGINPDGRIGHETRYSAVTILARQGVDLQLIQEIVGHSSEAMTMHLPDRRPGRTQTDHARPRQGNWTSANTENPAEEGLEKCYLSRCLRLNVVFL